MATINPLGDTLDDFYRNLIAGKSGIGLWKSLDLTGVECTVGGDLGDYDTRAALDGLKSELGDELHKRVRKLFRPATFSTRMSALCAIRAYLDAGLLGYEQDPYRTSCLVGGHNLHSKYLLKNGYQFKEEPAFIDPLCAVEGIDPNVPAVISEILGIKGPTYTLGAACASGNIALRDGIRDIITGECDRSVVTGALFDVSPADIHASAWVDAVVVRKDLLENPAAASRPFDANRGGFVYSHGTGVLIVEDLEAALARGAHIHAEILGIKASSDACHTPAPDSAEQERVMREVMREADIKPEQIDYVSCHATATPLGDLQEIAAIKGALGEHALKIKINAAKSMLGHTCWAAPIVETIAGILQMQHGMLHPTINVDELDPAIDLDVCADGPVEYEVTYMLKNSFGFGGLNCCSLIKKYEDGAA